jgi:putative ABC transport system permease protein
VAVAVTLELVARHHLHRPPPGAPTGSSRRARRPMKRLPRR